MHLLYSSVLEGFNATTFAYGQTGSGKVSFVSMINDLFIHIYHFIVVYNVWTRYEFANVFKWL